LIVGTNPRQLQFEFSLWTRDIVREVIRREFGVALSAVSVGRLLRTIGLSPQQPLYRAYQQDPEAVERWKIQNYPAIRAEAAQLGATIYFADEAAVRSDYHAGTTWAPVLDPRGAHDRRPTVGQHDLRGDRYRLVQIRHYPRQSGYRKIH
jgi:Winged helix-turn helix